MAKKSSTKYATVATVDYKAALCKLADARRGSMDASEHRHVVLGLISVKYISGRFEQHHAKLADEVAVRADRKNPNEYRAEIVLWVTEVGLFANQNTVCRPRTPAWRHTVERLKSRFPDWNRGDRSAGSLEHPAPSSEQRM